MGKAKGIGRRLIVLRGEVEIMMMLVLGRLLYTWYVCINLHAGCRITHTR